MSAFALFCLGLVFLSGWGILLWLDEKWCKGHRNKDIRTYGLGKVIGCLSMVAILFCTQVGLIMAGTVSTAAGIWGMVNGY